MSFSLLYKMRESKPCTNQLQISTVMYLQVLGLGFFCCFFQKLNCTLKYDREPTKHLGIKQSHVFQISLKEGRHFTCTMHCNISKIHIFHNWPQLFSAHPNILIDAFVCCYCLKHLLAHEHRWLWPGHSQRTQFHRVDGWWHFLWLSLTDKALARGAPKPVSQLIPF